MKPIERMVMHAGKVSGMSLAQVNAMLLDSGLEPVTDGNWRFVGRYVRQTSQDPTLLAKLSFGAAHFQGEAKVARPPASAAKPRFRVLQGGRR